MPSFPSAKEAKEFLVAQIVDEARREGVPLSEIERKMLYFSEGFWTLPDIMKVNEEFDQEYDSDEYEKKIAGLIAGAFTRAKHDDSRSLQTWQDAFAVLDKEDHYLIVMAQQAGVTGRKLWPVSAANQAGEAPPEPQPSSKNRRPWWVAAAIALFLSALLAASFYFGGYERRGVRGRQSIYELHENVPIVTFIGYVWAVVIMVGIALVWANPVRRLADRCLAGLRRAFSGRRN